MPEEYYWLNSDARKFLEKDYLEEGVSPEQRIEEIAQTAEKILNIPGFADKFVGYMKLGYYSLSSPVWANFGKSRGLPCSCNGSYIPDTMYGILDKVAEVGSQTKNGAGTSAYFGHLRPRGSTISTGGESSGPVHFMELFDCVGKIVSQSSVRRGAFAAYLDVEHPDILSFLKIRSEGNPLQNTHFGVCVSDDWMNSMLSGDKNKMAIWAKVIKKRYETGYPYIFFTDTVNNNAPQVYKDKNLKIWASNLCSEICLPATEEESFVCNLSSVNVLHWEEIKKTDAVRTMVYFLDAVMTEYIYKVKDIPFMKSSFYFATRHRALGLGILGWHSLLQSRMIAFESMQAKYLNIEIWKFIKAESDAATEELAKLFGEPELLKGYGRRNTTLLSVAPTTSSSFILGQVSAGIEPIHGNYFTKDLAKGIFPYKNPYLKELLIELKQNLPHVWKSIGEHGGSVAHLDFLTQEQKDVFKTFLEISQKEILIQAIARQRYIDQSQSLNLMINPKTPMKEMNQLLIFGWENGIKTFYYQRGQNVSQELGRSILTCASCEA